MRRLLLGLPVEDRRPVWTGTALLFLVMVSHGVLETARDALFLAELPAARLPWAYLAIAALALGVGAIHHRLHAAAARRGALVASLLVGAVVTGALWTVLPARGDAPLFALYVWTGLLATWLAVQIWLRLGELLDVVRAKSGFALAGAGGLAGAAAGALVAGAVLSAAPPRHLLAVAAVVLVAAAGIALGFGRGDEDAPAAPEEPALPLLGVLSAARGDGYLLRVLVLSALAPVTFTVVDLLFKSTVTEHVAAGDLGPFFARFHAVVNSLALAVQLGVAPALLARMGAVTSSAIFPVLLAAGAGATALLGGLVPVLLLRGADGALRHSLHRACSEILFLPVPPAERRAARFLAASLGQRGGQALASVGLLAALALGAGARELAAGAALLSLVWLAHLAHLRGEYVARFRAHLRSALAPLRPEVPKLELDSLETLIAALSSPEEEEVLAALDVLEAYGKERLVPGLILYHPSPRVVLRALELLAPSSPAAPPARQDVAGLVDRLLEHPDEKVRAAALRQAEPRLASDRLRALLRDDPSARVRASALAAYAGREATRPEDVLAAVSSMVERAGPAAARALARSLSGLPPELAYAVGSHLAEGGDRDVRTEVARALAARPDPHFLPLLISLLDTREARSEARRALVALGETALERLAQALAGRETSEAVRRHLPRTISRFGGARAVAILVEGLRRDEAAAVRFKILRGLGRLRADDPTLPVDPGPLLGEAERSLRRAVEMLALRVVVHLARVGAEPQDDLALLEPLLAEKEARALERVFRALHVLSPTESFETLHSGTRHPDRNTRAGSIEVLAHVVEDPLRQGLVAMAGFGSEEERLEEALAFHEPGPARRALELARKRGQPPDAWQAEVEKLVEESFAGIEGDRDPVLAAVAARELSLRRAGESSS